MKLNYAKKLKILKSVQSVVNDPVFSASIKTAESISKIIESKNENNSMAKLVSSFFGEVSKLDSLAKVSIEDLFLEIYDGDRSTFSKTLTSFVDYLPIWAKQKKYEKVFLNSPSGREAGSTTIYVINEFEQLMIKVDNRYKTSKSVGVISPTPDITEKYILDELMSVFNENFITIGSSSQPGPKEYEENPILTITTEEFIQRRESKVSNKEIEKIKKYLEKNISRSIMYYGPPGTGKSTIVNEIVRTLNLKSVRLLIDDIQTGAINTKKVLSAIKPDVVVIDDIDRLKFTSIQLLSLIENLRQNCKLLLLTCNKIKFDPVMIRPKRVDEVVPVLKFDNESIKELLGKDLEHLYDKVKDWPVAYIDELKDRADVLGVEEAVSSLNDLMKRIKNLKKKYKDENYIDDELCDVDD